MRFSIGYQLPDENDSTLEIARDFNEHISEVYFALGGEASGRSPLGLSEGWDITEVQSVMKEELSGLSQMGIDPVLLLNATCYGEEAISVSLAERIQKTISRLLDKHNLAAATTASPFIARIIKSKFSELKVRASVNMRIGTIKGMEYLADYFDGYYLQRELNRDPGTIDNLKSWCDTHGKTLHILVNSNCLKHCSFQSFHDNLVSHEAVIVSRENVPMRFPSPCWEYLSNREHWIAFLQNTWIRPEDIHHYDRWFSTAKLATRMHANPRKVIAAYSRGCFRGNLLDLMEPGYSSLLRGYIIDNTCFPGDWFAKVSQCNKKCQECSYCQSVFNKVLTKVEY